MNKHLKSLIQERQQIIGGLGLNNYLLAFENNRIISYNGAGCYIGLTWSNTPLSPLKHFIDWPFRDIAKRREKYFLKDEEKYLYWLMNFSPWQDAFLTKSPHKAYTKGIRFNVTYPVEYIVQAGILVRNITEYPTNMKLWNIFSQYINKTLAFILAINTDFFDEDKIIINQERMDVLGHQPFEPALIGRDEILFWLTNTLPPFTTSMRNKIKYGRLTKFWNENRKQSEIVSLIFPELTKTTTIPTFAGKITTSILNNNEKEIKDFAKRFLKLNKFTTLKTPLSIKMKNWNIKWLRNKTG